MQDTPLGGKGVPNQDLKGKVQLCVCSDFYSDDDPSPLASPRRSAISPGLYLSHFPGLSRLDLRIESASTQLMGVDHGGTFLYYSVEYHDANTNKGVLFGNATGRDSRSYRAGAHIIYPPRQASS